jgi:hypothetical protein
MLVCPHSKVLGLEKCQKTRFRKLFEKIPRITLTTPTLRVVKGKPPPNSEATWSAFTGVGLRQLEQRLSISRYCFGSASRGGFHAEQDAT